MKGSRHGQHHRTGEQPLRMLDEIYRLTELDFVAETWRLHEPRDLVNLFNLADAIDQFLLPPCVTRAVYLDADAWPDSIWEVLRRSVRNIRRSRHMLAARQCASGRDEVGSARWGYGANWSEGFRQDLLLCL